MIGNDISVDLDVGADSNTIGSVGAGANVMAGIPGVGHDDVSVLIAGGQSNTIDGNFMGTDSSGNPFSANVEGVRILGGSNNTFSQQPHQLEHRFVGSGDRGRRKHVHGQHDRPQRGGVPGPTRPGT